MKKIIIISFFCIAIIVSFFKFQNVVGNKNELSQSLSPYLLQHKSNPIWWKEWSKENLVKAKNQKKLIFVSIGYSTCHWCHVMNEESFSQRDVADILNKNYISIKIDREEYPDLDRFYQQTVNDLGQPTGWPLNLWLTPQGEVFFGASYLPKNDLLRTLKKIHEDWLSHPNEIKKMAKEALSSSQGVFSEKITSMNKSVLFEKHVNAVLERERRLARRLLVSPRFPRVAEILFLMEKTKLNSNANKLIFELLKNMASFGLYDPISGGFFRYTEDPEWKFPHFEKTLYDNAQIVDLYIEAYQKTNNEDYKRLCLQTLDWIERNLTSSDGGYYSGLDANREYYVFEKDKLEKVKNHHPEFDRVFEIRPEKDKVDMYLLMKSISKKISPALQQSLLKVRSIQRVPEKDKKIITAWNAILIETFTSAYRIFEDKFYLNKAQELAQFLLENHFNNGQLIRYSLLGKKGKILGTTEDYAFLIRALISLYQVDFNTKWLENAVGLQDQYDRLFWDDKKAVYCPKDDMKTSLSDQTIIDTELPPANLISYQNLEKLYFLFLKRDFKKRFVSLNANLASPLLHPIYYPSLMRHLFYIDRPFVELVIIGSKKNKEVQKVLEFAYHLTTKNLLVALGREGQDDLPVFKEKAQVHQNAVFYVCVRNSCLLPVKSSERAINIVKDIFQGKLKFNDINELSGK